MAGYNAWAEENNRPAEMKNRFWIDMQIKNESIKVEMPAVPDGIQLELYTTPSASGTLTEPSTFNIKRLACNITNSPFNIAKVL